MTTKSELIKAHQNGKILPIAVQTMSNTSSIVLLAVDDSEEKVFGYLAYGQDIITTKDYFYVKYKPVKEDMSFRVGQWTLHLGNFMRYGG